MFPELITLLLSVTSGLIGALIAHWFATRRETKSRKLSARTQAVKDLYQAYTQALVEKNGKSEETYRKIAGAVSMFVLECKRLDPPLGRIVSRIQGQLEKTHRERVRFNISRSIGVFDTITEEYSGFLLFMSEHLFSWTAKLNDSSATTQASAYAEREIVSDSAPGITFPPEDSPTAG